MSGGSSVVPVSRASAHKAQGKSRVSNGSSLHAVPVTANKWSRRFADLIEEFAGGPLNELGQEQRSLVRRLATLSIEAEKLEAKAASGEEIDADLYGQITDRMNRAFSRLGRVKKEPGAPSLDQYLKGKKA